jgi:aldose 1-epimerase
VPTAAPLPPTGEQFRISAGDIDAVVTEVGAGLRSFTAAGLPYVETFDLNVRPPQGSGTLLVPWPNRTAGGRWNWDGATQQLALTEPARGNAIHGLVRFTFFDVVERADHAITLGARIAVQSGWPVPLAVRVRYAVAAAGLTVTYTVENLGADAVPFGIGAHPYLRVGEVATDECTLVLAASTALPLDGGLPAGPARPVSGDDDFRNGRPVKDLVLDNAFGGCAPADGDHLVRHRLLGPAGGLELWAEPAFGWVQVFTPDDHPGRGRAIAVEPMTCPPDALNSGTGLIMLAPAESWTGSWGLRPT